MTLKIMKPLDIAVAAVVAAIALVSAIPLITSANASPDAAAENAAILYDGGKLNLPLSRDGVFTVESNGYTLEITVENRSIRVSESNCPDKLCVGCGAISRSGQVIICMPARVLIEVEGGETDVDAVAG